MLQKPEINTSLMGHLARTHTLPLPLQYTSNSAPFLLTLAKLSVAMINELTDAACIIKIVLTSWMVNLVNLSFLSFIS